MNRNNTLILLYLVTFWPILYGNENLENQSGSLSAQISTGDVTFTSVSWNKNGTSISLLQPLDGWLFANGQGAPQTMPIDIEYPAMSSPTGGAYKQYNSSYLAYHPGEDFHVRSNYALRTFSDSIRENEFEFAMQKIFDTAVEEVYPAMSLTLDGAYRYKYSDADNMFIFTDDSESIYFSIGLHGAKPHTAKLSNFWNADIFTEGTTPDVTEFTPTTGLIVYFSTKISGYSANQVSQISLKVRFSENEEGLLEKSSASNLGSGSTELDTPDVLGGAPPRAEAASASGGCFLKVHR